MGSTAVFKGGFTGSNPPEIITRKSFSLYKNYMLHNMWPLVLGQKPLKCQEKPFGVYKMQQTTGAAGAPPGPRWGSLQRSPRTLAGGEGLAALSSRTPPHSRPFRPRASALWASPLPAPNFLTPSEVKSYIWLWWGTTNAICVVAGLLLIVTTNSRQRFLGNTENVLPFYRCIHCRDRCHIQLACFLS